MDLPAVIPNSSSRIETKSTGLNSSSSTTLGYFSDALCVLLEKYSVRYCLIGASEDDASLPDLVVHPADRDRFCQVFEPLRQDGFEAVQCVPIAVDSHRFYFARLRDPQVRFVCVNVVCGYRGERLKWENATALVERRVRCGNHWGVSARDEFAYWLGRNSLRGTLEQHRARRLQALAVELGAAEAGEIAERIYPEERTQEIVRACVDGTIRSLTEPWKKQLKRKVMREHPVKEVVYALKDIWRLAQRWLKPSGLLLAFLGPDGVGKSTTAAIIKQDLSPLFSQQREFHWRPQLLVPRQIEPDPSDCDGVLREMFSQNRHGDPRRGLWISIARMLGVMLDYWIGYFTLIRAHLGRSGLIVFDRYYHDILVDSMRYRYGGPKWLLGALRFTLPPWRVFFIILDADEQIVYSRKQELALCEIKFQRAAYRDLSTKLTSAMLLRTDSGLEVCRNQALRGIVEHLGQRFRSSFEY